MAEFVGHAFRASVCMATFNGAAYVEEQVASILAELGPSDEVIIVDDGSSDGTINVIQALDDRRVRLIHNVRNLGHVRTFERALSEARGRFVFLADQDDIWIQGRVEVMISALADADVVATNLEAFGVRNLVPTSLLSESDSEAGWKNIVGIFLGKRAYFGSAMAMRSDFLPFVLPIPSYMEAHDLWIALLGNSVGRVSHLEQPSVRRRVHDSNLTPARRRPLLAVVRTRILFLRGLFDAAKRGCGRRRASETDG